jgi:hypothetical protein
VEAQAPSSSIDEDDWPVAVVDDDVRAPPWHGIPAALYYQVWTPEEEEKSLGGGRKLSSHTSWWHAHLDCLACTLY